MHAPQRHLRPIGRGRSLGHRVTAALASPARLGLHHFAHLRAVAEGLSVAERRNNSRVTSSSDERGCSCVIARKTAV